MLRMEQHFLGMQISFVTLIVHLCSMRHTFRMSTEHIMDGEIIFLVGMRTVLLNDSKTANWRLELVPLWVSL
jgi:hypothetical protein